MTNPNPTPTQFVNLTNHPFSKWPAKEVEAANGNVIDLPFPAVDPNWGVAEIIAKAGDVISTLRGLLGGNISGCTVLCQGEARLQYALVTLLMREGARVLAATSVRSSVDVTNPDGSVEKKVVFVFDHFADYPNLE